MTRPEPVAGEIVVVPTKQDMHHHVTELCAQHGIVYSWCRRPTDAWAWLEGEEVCIPPIKSRISYATALHELGHILGQHQQSKRSMVRERYAWRWARRNALIWTSVMERNAVKSLGFAAIAAERLAERCLRRG